MSCEEAFAKLGRKIDDAWYAVTNRRKPKGRVGPSVRERVGERVHMAQDWIHHQGEKLEAARHNMDPRTRTALLVVSAMVLSGVGVWVGMRYWGTGNTRLSGEEIQALDRLRSSGGAMNLFASPPVDSQPAAAQGGSPMSQSDRSARDLLAPPR